MALVLGTPCRHKLRVLMGKCNRDGRGEPANRPTMLTNVDIKTRLFGRDQQLTAATSQETSSPGQDIIAGNRWSFATSPCRPPTTTDSRDCAGAGGGQQPRVNSAALAPAILPLLTNDKRPPKSRFSMSAFVNMDGLSDFTSAACSVRFLG